MQPHPWNYPPEGPKPCRFSGSIPQAAGLSVRKITTHMPATERKPRDQRASSQARPITQATEMGPGPPVPYGEALQGLSPFTPLATVSRPALTSATSWFLHWKKSRDSKGRGENSWGELNQWAFEWVSVALGWPPGSFSLAAAASHSKRGHH